MRQRFIPWLTALGVGMGLPAWAAPEFLGLYQLPERPIAWGEALSILRQGDVVIVGENHDSAETHRIELATLQALAETGQPLILSLEMFEADVQPVLDAYLAGTIPEATFLAQSRPWPNYATDYRPLIEYAKTKHLPVMAANVPRPLAAKVAREGFEGLQTLPWRDARHAALPPTIDPGAPWDRFQAAMGEHGGPPGTPSSLWRMYEAQTLKDVTMARSIGTALATSRAGTKVLHVQGRFHSDFGAGVPAYLRRFLPGRAVRVLTVLPVETAQDVTLQDKAGLADVVGFVPSAPAADTRTP